jgi:hypothetical protein
MSLSRHINFSYKRQLGCYSAGWHSCNVMRLSNALHFFMVARFLEFLKNRPKVRLFIVTAKLQPVM